MHPRLCPRCHADLHTEDTGDLTYCSHCGAAQVALSEELREQLEQQQLAAQQPSGSSTPGTLSHQAIEPPIVDPAAVVWSSALQLIGLAGALFAALMLLQHALAPIVLLTMLWLLGAPIILIGLYCARNPRTRISTGFGARLGLLTGLSMAICGLVVETVAAFVNRFLLHQGNSMDQQLASALAQLQKQQLAQVPAEQMADVQHIYSYAAVPEFVIGALLFTAFAFLVGYTLYSTLAGAFSGLMRSRSATR